MITQLWVREWVLCRRARGEWLQPVLFYGLVMLLFPLSVGSNAQLLQTLAPAMVWIALLLSVLLVLPRLFREDFLDGTLPAFFSGGVSIVSYVVVKLVVQSCVLSLPIVLLSPGVVYVLGVSGHAALTVGWTLLLGLPILYTLGGLVSALMLSEANPSPLLALLLLPLYIPTLIFATLGVHAALQGLPVTPFLALLGAMALVCMTFFPLLIRVALRLAMGVV